MPPPARGCLPNGRWGSPELRAGMVLYCARLLYNRSLDSNRISYSLNISHNHFLNNRLSLVEAWER